MILQASYEANAEVELATSTIYDTVALRTEREFLRNVFDGKNALTKYDPFLHDWAHSFKFSKVRRTSYDLCMSYHNQCMLLSLRIAASCTGSCSSSGGRRCSRRVVLSAQHHRTTDSTLRL